MKYPGALWAVDPGKARCAVALFLEGQLWAAHFIERGSVGKPCALGDIIVIEQPVSYPDSPVDANDLIEIAVQGATIAGTFVKASGAIVHVRPNEWKGTCPKEITAARSRKILGAMENTRLDEYLNKHARGIRHNLLDAVGIGLFQLGRAGRGMVPRT